MQDRARSHLCDHLPVPADIHDVLLWRLAVDVASAHRPGPDGRCTNLLCAGQSYPCPPASNAQAAAHAARRPSRQPPRLPMPPARGHAAVPTGAHEPPDVHPDGGTREPGPQLATQQHVWPPPLRHPEATQAA